MEESLAQNYGILKRYLAQSLRDEKGNPKPNRARDKPLRLWSVQFQELSTDVYDELLRRQSQGGPQANGVQTKCQCFFSPKRIFHPERNQARQKLATLPPPRFLGSRNWYLLRARAEVSNICRGRHQKEWEPCSKFCRSAQSWKDA